MTTIYDELYSQEDLYILSNRQQNSKDDTINIVEITSELRFNKDNVLQQKVKVRGLTRDKDGFWKDFSDMVWVDVPKEGETTKVLSSGLVTEPIA